MSQSNNSNNNNQDQVQYLPSSTAISIEYDCEAGSNNNKPSTFAYPVSISPTIVTEVQPLSGYSPYGVGVGDNLAVYAVPQQMEGGIQLVAVDNNNQNAVFLEVDPGVYQQRRRFQTLAGFTIFVIIMILVYVSYSS
mmetsp:Transcript_29195/g.31845  ORF Transcript_29195/g.31845 Transcript_29195/m.31845 type:complete len:137 (+) Transcript_29195:55-465(+)